MAVGLQSKTDQETPKFESFVEQKISKVRSRIRAVDIAGYALIWLGVTLCYLLAMTWLDRTYQFPTVVRIAALAVYGLFTLTIGIAVLRIALRRVNPYFAARRLEGTIPTAKNSLVNWLDLRDAEIPEAIRTNLTKQAAVKAKGSDTERAAPATHTWWLAAVTAALVVVFLISFFAGGGQFRSLLQRAFVPFGETQIATTTQITIEEPAVDHLRVPLDRSVRFRAAITGNVPKENEAGAPELWFHYSPNDPTFHKRPLVKEPDGKWAATVLSDEIQSGLWYKVRAGDAETAIRRVEVITFPAVLNYEVKYAYRPYRKMESQTVTFPNADAVFPRLKGHIGTHVTLTAKTNRELKSGWLELQLDGRTKQLDGAILPGDSKAVQFQFVLTSNGKFRVGFESKGDEVHPDRTLYEMEVIPDFPSQVVLTKPGQDIELPANGTLSVKGFASDDIGVKSLALGMRALKGADIVELPLKPYRKGVSFQFDDGTYPKRLEYADVVALEKLKTSDGNSLPLAADMVLEYWLEARDNCDFPDPDGHLSKSKVYRVLIVDPEMNQEKRQTDREKAEKDRKQHEQNQDKQQAAENEKRNEEKQAQNNAGGTKKSLEEQKRDDKMKQTQKKLEEELNKQKEQEKKKGDAKGADSPQSDKKDNPDGKSPGKQKDAPKDDKQAGQPKGADEKGGNEQAGKGKNGGNKEPSPQNAKAKDDGDKTGDPKSNGSSAKKKPDENKDAGKGKGPPQQKENPAQAKQKDGNGMQDAGKGKQDTKPGSGTQQAAKGDKKGDGDQSQKAQAKGADGDGKKKPDDKSTAKSNPSPNDPKSGAKGKDINKSGGTDAQAKKDGTDDSKSPGMSKGTDQTEPKSAQKDKSDGGGPKQAQGKDGKDGPKSPGSASAKKGGDKKGDGSASARNEEREPTMEDIAKLQKQMQSKEKAGSYDPREKLKKWSEKAKDPDVRKAAKKALDQANNQNAGQGKAPGPKGNQLGKGQAKTPGETANGEPKDPGKQGSAKAKSGDEKTGEGKSQGGDPGNSKIAKGDKKSGKIKPGTFGKAGDRIGKNPVGKNPNLDYTRKSGNLTLDQLKNKVDDDVLKKAGVSKKEWQDFVKARQDYDRWLANQKRTAANKGDKRPPTGGVSKRPNQGPFRVDSGQRKPGEVDVGRALPPLEFREAQRLFTNRPKNK